MARKRRSAGLALGLTMTRLAMESQHVIALRLAKLSAGGAPARKESVRMVSEKVAAAGRAGGMLASGKSPEQVLAFYRKRVAANRRRLG